MAPTQAPKIIFGTAGIANLEEDNAKAMLEVLQKHGVGILDTASLYTSSEVTLAKYGAPSKFTIHTKAPGFRLGAQSKKGVIEGMEKSLKDLGVDSVDTYYLHSPDPDTPLEETLSAISELHAAGKFKHFGISNFTPDAVLKIHNIQKSANAILPTVFQGNYNPVSRHIESDLFPLLRKLNISFNAYSPIAGGFLVKDSASVRSKEITGRFNDKTGSGSMYSTMYNKESLLTALDEWGVIAKEAGVSKAALAYRWIVWHSELQAEKGDGVIVGASRKEQLEETLAAVEEGPLKEDTVKKVEAIWEKVKADAPRDNWNSYAASASK